MVLKSIITTGCFIYPVDITCIEIFDWYVIGSTSELNIIQTWGKNYDLQTPLLSDKKS